MCRPANEAVPEFAAYCITRIYYVEGGAWAEFYRCRRLRGHRGTFFTAERRGEQIETCLLSHFEYTPAPLDLQRRFTIEVSRNKMKALLLLNALRYGHFKASVEDVAQRWMQTGQPVEFWVQARELVVGMHGPRPNAGSALFVRIAAAVAAKLQDGAADDNDAFRPLIPGGPWMTPLSVENPQHAWVTVATDGSFEAETGRGGSAYLLYAQGNQNGADPLTCWWGRTPVQWCSSPLQPELAAIAWALTAVPRNVGVHILCDNKAAISILVRIESYRARDAMDEWRFDRAGASPWVQGAIAELMAARTAPLTVEHVRAHQQVATFRSEEHTSELQSPQNISRMPSSA